MRSSWTSWLILASPLQLSVLQNHWAALWSQGKQAKRILLAKHCPMTAPLRAPQSKAEGRKKHQWQTSFARISSGWTYSGLLLCTCDPTGEYGAMPAGWASRAEKEKVASASPAWETYYYCQPHLKNLFFWEDHLPLLLKGWYLQDAQGQKGGGLYLCRAQQDIVVRGLL